MPNIKISHCLVCDTARPEMGNKISLLGFFGIAPNVEVQLDRLDLPVNELTFVFVGTVTGIAGPADIVFEIFDWSDKTVITVPSQTQVLQVLERSNFIFSVRMLKFPHPGRYKIRLRADGRPIYNTDFLISQNPVLH